MTLSILLIALGAAALCAVAGAIAAFVDSVEHLAELAPPPEFPLDSAGDPQPPQDRCAVGQESVHNARS